MYITCTCIYIYNIAIAPPPKPSCHPSPLFVPCLITPAESQTLWHLEGFLISGSFGSVHSENKKHTMGFDRWGYGCLKMVNTSRPQEWLFRRENDDKPENLAVLYVQTNLYWYDMMAIKHSWEIRIDRWRFTDGKFIELSGRYVHRQIWFPKCPQDHRKMGECASHNWK